MYNRVILGKCNNFFQLHTLCGRTTCMMGAKEGSLFLFHDAIRARFRIINKNKEKHIHDKVQPFRPY